jgi:hypothetical protein
VKAAAIAAFLGGTRLRHFVCKRMLQLGHKNGLESAVSGARMPTQQWFQRRADTNGRVTVHILTA